MSKEEEEDIKVPVCPKCKKILMKCVCGERELEK